MDSPAVVLFGGVCAILGGLLSGAYEHIRDVLTRPRLSIDFEGGSANLTAAEYMRGDKRIAELYVRVRIRNKGKRIGTSCRVFLTRLLEVQPSGATVAKFYDARQLAWAGYEFSARDIPRGVDFYVDVVRISKHESGWLFGVEKLFASELELLRYRGTYRFQLLVTADNAKPAACAVDVSYDGDWHGLRALKPR